MTKERVTITVSGPPKSGKSTIMRLVADTLGAYDIETELEELGEEPLRITGEDAEKAKEISSRTQVVLTDLAKPQVMDKAPKDGTHILGLWCSIIPPMVVRWVPQLEVWFGAGGATVVPEAWIPLPPIPAPFQS